MMFLTFSDSDSDHVMGNLSGLYDKCSTVAEMGDRLATIDMVRKLGGCAHGDQLGPHVTQYGLGRGLPSYQVAS